jgi:hypothetical protein
MTDTIIRRKGESTLTHTLNPKLRPEAPTYKPNKKITVWVTWGDSALTKLGLVFGGRIKRNRRYAKDLTVKIRQKMLRYVDGLYSSNVPSFMLVQLSTQSFTEELQKWMQGFGVSGTVSSEVAEVVEGTRDPQAYNVRANGVVFVVRQIGNDKIFVM